MRVRRQRIHQVAVQNTIAWVIVLLALIVGGVIVLLQPGAGAATFSWKDKAVKVEPLPDKPDVVNPEYMSYTRGPLASGMCTPRSVKVSSLRDALVSNVCVYQGKGFRYAVLHHEVLGYGFRDDFLIGFPFDETMFLVQGLPAGGMYYTPNSPHLAFVRYDRFTVVRDVLTKLKPHITGTGKYYEVAAKDVLTPFKDNEPSFDISLHGVGISENGNWAVVEPDDGGLVRINLQTGAMKLFSNKSLIYNQGSPPRTSMAISDDGNRVAVMGYRSPNALYELDGCGSQEFKVFQSQWRWIKDDPVFNNSCTPVELSAAIRSVAKGNISATNPWFEDSAGASLLVYIQSEDNYPWLNGSLRWIRLSAGSYSTTRKLDYLALGDSYASGEGDLGKKADGSRYYRVDTEMGDMYDHAPFESCHISTRSYPYLLASSMGLGAALPNQTTQWQTVACSGATAWDVKKLGTEAYLGQGDVLKSFNNADSLKIKALGQFIPGWQKQYEFVRRYKPTAVTIMMGGNDVGFAQRLKRCLSLDILSPALFTCSEANEGVYRARFASEIASQYENLRSLYAELINASGSPLKLYVVGYPQLVDVASAPGCSNVWTMNDKEKLLIHNSVIYLNNVIEKAAKAAGAKYIDIEQSLGPHVLCSDNESYINGIMGVFDSYTESDSFHPNTKGHQVMASAIKNQTQNQSLLTYDFCGDGKTSCPDPTVTEDSIEVPLYFQDLPEVNAHYMYFTQSNFASTREPISIALDEYLLEPSTKATLTIHSQPLVLGEYTVAENGSLNIDVRLPDGFEPGYHTLTIEANSFSGKPVLIEQIVYFAPDPEEVRSNSSGDVQAGSDDDVADKHQGAPLQENEDVAASAIVQADPVSLGAKIDTLFRQLGEARSVVSLWLIACCLLLAVIISCTVAFVKRSKNKEKSGETNK